MGYDWTDDDTQSPEEIRARVAALPKADVREVETMPGTLPGGDLTLAFATKPSSKEYRYARPLGSESELATVVA